MTATEPPPLCGKPQRGQTVDLRIDQLTAKGLAEASLTAEIGPQRERHTYRVHVRRALLGERVRVEIMGHHRGAYQGRLLQLLEPSPQRIKPRCQHFDGSATATGGALEPPCGGCSLQALPYPEQLKLKQRQVEQLLMRAQFDAELVAPVIGQQTPWYYRNKMEYTFGQRPDGSVVLGLHPAGSSRQVLSLQQCHLLSPFGSRLLPKLSFWINEVGVPAYNPQRNWGFLRTLTLREGKRTGERMLELTTTADPQVHCRSGPLEAQEIAQSFCSLALSHAGQLGAELSSIYWTQHHAVRGQPTRFIHNHLHGQPLLHETVQLPGERQLRFEIHPRAFFQPNTLQAEVLYTEVLRAAGLPQETTTSDVVLDLNCGTGTIALCMAPYCQHVIGIELQPDAVANAQRNAVLNGLDNTQFIAGDVGKVLARPQDAAIGPIDLVIVDPPRSGLAAAALAHIQAINASGLVYVSCNPEALARDLLQLARHGYRVQGIQPIDMFPQTAHIECVARLDRPARP